MLSSHTLARPHSKYPTCSPVAYSTFGDRAHGTLRITKGTVLYYSLICAPSAKASAKEARSDTFESNITGFYAKNTVLSELKLMVAE